jgi:hypothetical protein
MEALLIRTLGLSTNLAQMKFRDADEWSQVTLDEVDEFLAKVAS